MEQWDPDVGLEDFPTELRELLVDDAAGLREAFEQVQAQWDETIARAKALPEAKRHESVDGEWSLTRTLRHLVYATDIWISRLVFGESQPYHPWGQPFTELEDLDALGLDLDAEPSFARSSRSAPAGSSASVTCSPASPMPTSIGSACPPTRRHTPPSLTPSRSASGP